MTSILGGFGSPLFFFDSTDGFLKDTELVHSNEGCAKLSQRFASLLLVPGPISVNVLFFCLFDSTDGF